MSHVLGIVGSARPWGNSELLVRQTLLGAQAEGASVHLLRLSDLRIESCTGCMRCIIGGQSCPIHDDMAWLVETIVAQDSLVLAAPTYWLGPAAVVKLVLDRLLMFTGRLSEPLRAPRPAVTIATAGLEGWQGVALPFLNVLVTGFGYRPIQSFVAVAPGPGEVLLDDALMAQVHSAGRRLGRGELLPAPAAPNVCPICGCQAFSLCGERAVCPICGREASIELGPAGIRLQFSDAVAGLQRWTPEGLRHHMIDWVQATGPRFLARRSEIKARRAAYRQLDIEWLRPAVPEMAEEGGEAGNAARS